ncbi:MAG: FHA domain-containing protein [Planctomycetes bacterium]|nr:FHA domain-containing protein [Planctomycetota bacterium]
MNENKDKKKNVNDSDIEKNTLNNDDNAEDEIESEKNEKTDENDAKDNLIVENNELKPDKNSANVEKELKEEKSETGFEMIDAPYASKPEKPVKIKLIHLEGSRKERIDIIDLTSLPDMVCTIGRDPECVLAFDPYKDQRVSSVHARIFFKNDEIFIEDLNSTNGTRINGIKIFEMAKLRNGDEIELGRKGVSFEIARILEESEEAEIKKFQRISNKDISKDNRTLKMALNDAARRAKDDGGGSIKFIKEMVKQVSTESNSNLKLLLVSLSIVIAILFICLIIVVALLFNELDGNETRMQERDKLLIDKINEQNGKSSAKDDDNNGTVNIHKIEDRFSTDIKKDAERVKDENHIRNNPGIERFKKVNQVAREAIYLVYSQVELQDEKGKKYLCEGSGTGFVVTSDGHLITNKHVVKPWLFEKTARKIRRNNLKILMETHNVLAWKTGVVALTDSHEWKKSTAFSMLQRQLTIANEGFDSFTVIEDEELGEIRVHRNDSNDLILLKLIGSNFKHLEVYDARKSADWKPEQLDTCLVIGYPEGKNMIEGVNAEPSSARGAIRKIEKTIAIDVSVLRGNSGGPAIAIDTVRDVPVVIGVTTRVAKNTETFVICIKSRYILDLIPPTPKK